MTEPAGQLYRVEPLSDRHSRSGFSCGVESLDRYLCQQAGQDARRRVTSVFLLVESQTGSVAGFYTLANTAIDPGRLPEDIARRLPKYPLIPATLLGRLALAQRFQGRKLGQFLLMDALRRSLDASTKVASFAVVVEAIDEAAASFYQRHGFIAFADPRQRLFLPMQTVARSFI